MIGKMFMWLIIAGVAVGTYRYVIPFLITGTSFSENVFTYIVPFCIMLAGIIGVFMVLKRRRIQK